MVCALLHSYECGTGVSILQREIDQVSEYSMLCFHYHMSVVFVVLLMLCFPVLSDWMLSVLFL